MVWLAVGLSLVSAVPNGVGYKREAPIHALDFSDASESKKAALAESISVGRAAPNQNVTGVSINLFGRDHGYADQGATHGCKHGVRKPSLSYWIPKFGVWAFACTSLHPGREFIGWREAGIAQFNCYISPVRIGLQHADIGAQLTLGRIALCASGFRHSPDSFGGGPLRDGDGSFRRFRSPPGILSGGASRVESAPDKFERGYSDNNTGERGGSHDPLGPSIAAPFIVRIGLWFGIGIFGVWLAANRAWNYLHDWRRFYGLLLLGLGWFSLWFYLLIGRGPLDLG